MKAISKIGFSVIASCILLGTNASAFTDGHHHTTATTTRLGTTLTNPTNTGIGGGSVTFTSNTSSGNINLQANIYLPIVAGSPVLGDALDAKTAILSAYTYTLTVPATNISCTLSIDEIDFSTPTSAVAKFKVSDSGTVSAGFTSGACAGSTLASGDTINITDGTNTLFSGVLTPIAGH